MFSSFYYIPLFHIADLEIFFENVNCCEGHVYLELKDESYLNLKGNGEGKFFMESMGQEMNGLRLVVEKPGDVLKMMDILTWDRLSDEFKNGARKADTPYRETGSEISASSPKD